jgi:sec-independent protein translocase protein TatB
MFDFGWGELVVIGIVALIVIGPKELPTVLRTVGQWTTKIRRMAGEFQAQFQEAMREAEMADLKREVDEATKNFTSNVTSHFDALETTPWEPKTSDRLSETAEGNKIEGERAEAAKPDVPAIAEDAHAIDRIDGAAPAQGEVLAPSVPADADPTPGAATAAPRQPVGQGPERPA